ncbi:MAG: autoinducer binding domain-containing protein [Nitrospirae bacterium]|nr:autoinducer binding domain-containing protein [Nitrospirota bacterium]
MMREPLRQQQSVSEDALCGEFPFIQRGGHDHASPRSTQRRLGNGYIQTSHQQNLRKQPRRFPSEIFEDLTKREIQSVVEILHYSAEATTGDDVYQILQLIQRAVACPKVIGGVAQLTASGGFKEFNSVINVSYSNDWLYTYGKEGYASVDPVLQSLLSSFKTQVWEQTYGKASSPKQLEFIEEARSAGLTHGVTTGMLERERGFATFFSFAGGEADGAQRFAGLLEYLLPALHRVLIANANTPLFNRVKGLSPREVTVLMWMKEGKTNWEIARIVGVTERTVRFHVEGIFMKLDVSSRTQAVAVAMEHGLLPTE